MSDFHGGDLSSRDDRTREDRQLFCDTLPADDLILCGDILDFWRAGGAVLEANKDIIAALEGHTQRRAHGVFPFYRVWYLCGNHDPIADVHDVFGRVQVCEHLLLDRTFYTHGCLWDLANGRWPKVGKAIVGIGNVAGRISPWLEDWLAGAAGKLRGTGRYGEAEQQARAALDFIRHWPQVQRICCGHSHVKGKATDSETGKKYLNLGCFERGKPIWTAI